MWDVLTNKPSAPNCPLCRAIYSLDDQANLIAMMTVPMNTSMLSTCPPSREVVDLTKRSLPKRTFPLSIEEIYAELFRLPDRQMSKKAKNRLKCRLFQQIKIIEQN